MMTAWFSHACMAFLVTISISQTGAADEFVLRTEKDSGISTLYEGERPVFGFVEEPRLQAGVEQQYARAGYLHPLYGLEGQPLTLDFPEDHYHHRGIWVSWPKMNYRGREVQLWHPSPLRQKFDRWLNSQMGEGRARLSLQNNWVLEGEVVGREQWEMTVHAAEEDHQTIDLALTLSATEQPIRLTGAPTADKGYGGLCIRTSNALAQGQLRTDQGKLEGDATQRQFRWAGLSAEEQGLIIFAHPSNPNHPPTWLLRSSYGGVINPQWPGLKEVELEPGHPVTLRYRLYIHSQQPTDTEVQAAYERWVNAEPAR